MRTHTQNLNKKQGKVVGSMFWHGRGWLHGGSDDLAKVEWLFGKFARDFAAKVTFGSEDDRGIMFHVCIPFLLSVYLTLGINAIHAKERRLGFAIHNQSLWLYVFDSAWSDIRPKDRVWYQRYYSFNFPWQHDWYSTEVLTQNTPELAESVYIEKRGDRHRLGIDSIEQMRQKEAVEKNHSRDLSYTYILKNNEVQIRVATIYVSRMVWRMRWWPLLPFKKVSTTISVKFDKEVGEGSGSYKGGCVGCGYEMRANESPSICLRRMEYERKFDR